MGNVNSIQTSQSYSFFDSNKPYLVSAILISASVALFIKGCIWGNYSHIGCGALIGAGAISAISGLALICLKSCCSNKQMKESISTSNQSTSYSIQSQSSDSIYVGYVAALKKDPLACIKLLKMVHDEGIDINHPIMVSYFVDLIIDNSVIASGMLSLNLLNPNIPDNQGRLVLHEAVKANRLHIVEKLLDQGADKQKVDKNGKTALDYISDEVIYNLITTWKASDAALHQAVQKNNREQLLKALDEGADIHSTRFDATPLATAIRQKRFQLIKDLLDRGASIDRMGGLTILNMIAISRSLKDEDLEDFCDVTHKEFSSENTETLMFQYYDELLQLFRDKGFELEKLDEGGCTPLYFTILMKRMNPFFARYLIRSCDVSNAETSPSFAAAVIFYLSDSVPNSVEYNEALNILDTLLRNNVGVYKRVMFGSSSEHLLGVAKSFSSKHDDLKTILIKITKKGLEQLVSGACPQDEEQKNQQQINLSESLDILSSENVVAENTLFLQEMFAQAVDNGHLHLITSLSEFIKIDVPWNGLTPLQRAKSEGMRKRLIELGAKEGS